MDPSQYTTHVDGRAAEFTGRRAGDAIQEQKIAGDRRGQVHLSLIACIHMYVAIRMCIYVYMDRLDR